VDLLRRLKQRKDAAVEAKVRWDLVFKKIKFLIAPFFISLAHSSTKKI